jgi:hypothetical protein
MIHEVFIELNQNNVKKMLKKHTYTNVIGSESNCYFSVYLATTTIKTTIPTTIAIQSGIKHNMTIASVLKPEFLTL